MADAAANQGWSPSRSAAGAYSPWLIVAIISIPTFMEVLDTAIANVALDHIGGSLSVSTDQATWVLTSYLVANAIIIPISGWLSDAIGRKRYFLLSIILFTGASFLCGISPNLTTLVIARVLQGIGGGGLAPVEQSILADTFPPDKRGMAFAAFAIVVVVGPVLGPTLGGYIVEYASWHWVFLINVPVGIIAFFLVTTFVDEPEQVTQDRKDRFKNGLNIDYIGVALVALGLGFFELHARPGFARGLVRQPAHHDHRLDCRGFARRARDLGAQPQGSRGQSAAAEEPQFRSDPADHGDHRRGAVQHDPADPADAAAGAGL